MTYFHERAILSKLEQEQFDIIIVGGGILGSGILRDATLRGLKCLLIEKNDFASGTSSKSGKLIHGGLRYLKQLQLHLVYESCRERFYLSKKIAPHIVKPTKFIMPFYQQSHVSRKYAACGLFLYDALALFRNFERFRFVSKQKLFAMEPQLLQTQSTGALTYTDAMGMDARLVVDTIKSAVAAGATVVNYCELLHINVAETTHTLMVKDQWSGKEYSLQTEVMVNATGAWGDVILQKIPKCETFKLKCSGGIHLIVDRQRLGLNHTMAIEAPSDYRNLYLIPWGNVVLIGTTDTVCDGPQDDIEINQNSVEYLLDAVNHYFPKAILTKQDVMNAYAGIRALVGMELGEKVGSVSREEKILVDKRGIVSVTGGKLTTYRSIAEKVVNTIHKEFFPEKKIKKCSTVSPLLATRGGGGTPPLQQQFPNDCVGAGFPRPALSQYIHEKLPYTWGDIDNMVHHEFVVTLGDLLQRRMMIDFYLPQHGKEIVEPVARHMGQLLGWNETRINNEINNYGSRVLHQPLAGSVLLG